MNKILALWAVPRSRSTAFEYMMRTRGDHVCLHEPFGEVWYQGKTGVIRRNIPGGLHPDSRSLQCGNTSGQRPLQATRCS